MSLTHTGLASIIFVTAIVAWGVPKLLGSMADAAPQPAAVPAMSVPDSAVNAGTPAVTSVAGSPAAGMAATQSGESTVPVPRSTVTVPGRTQPMEPAAGTAARATVEPTPPTAPAALSEAEEIALQRQLEQEGKAYLRALQAQDTAAVGAMLAGRCARTDVAALVTRRRAEISAVAGVPIDQLTPLNQFVGHFDAGAGEAHTVLQLDNAGTRVQLPTADGWLVEGGSWKSVVC